jgi:serine protease AprX
MPNTTNRRITMSIFRRLGAAFLSATLLFGASSALAQGNSGSNNGNGGDRGSNSGNRADNGRNRISDDLDQALRGRGSGRERWVRQTVRGQQMSVLFLANGRADPDLRDLRRAITAAGGSVNRKFRSVTGISALVPAARIRELAQRSDVWRVTPNRVVSRTFSTMELLTGADGVRGLGGTAALDGSGVGIAILDSGVMASHNSLLGGNGVSRV